MDHVGGVEDLAKRIPVDTFIDHGPNAEHLPPGEVVPPDLPGGAPDQLYPKYLEAIKGHKHIVAKPGQVIQIGSMTDTIVASDGVVDVQAAGRARARPIRLATRPEAKSQQATMAARRIPARSPRCCTFGKVTIAMFGDLSWEKERELSCPAGKLGHVNLLIVTQHGSNISSNPASIADMHPDVALMGTGGKKGGDEARSRSSRPRPG